MTGETSITEAPVPRRVVLGVVRGAVVPEAVRLRVVLGVLHRTGVPGETGQ